MKKIILITMAAIFAIGVTAQQKIRVWKNNSLVYEEDVTQIDSITFYEEFEGALIGVFSVSPTKKVRFSKGNLQYQASTDTWQFAKSQYEYIGTNNANISPTYSGWIDLFGFGTGNNPTNTSTDNNNYSTFVDWGVNAISNGGNKANVWRTLTNDEWGYLFCTRTNAASLFGLGSVNNVNGTIILPDNWSTPQGISFIPSSSKGLADQDGYYVNSNRDNFSHNTYTAEQWLIMESAGAVFLPAAGARYGKYGSTYVFDFESNGSYRSSTPYDAENAYYLIFSSFDLYPQFYINRCDGHSVRLVQDLDNNSSDFEHPTIIHDTTYIPVHDTIYITIHDTVCPNEIPEGALNGVFSVAEDKKVRFAKGNLQFHMKDSIWRFADNQYEVLGEANSNCGDPSYDGYIDLFGWSTTSTYFGINTSTSNDTYNGDFVDWGTNINDGWFTLNHDEWTYLYQGRPNAADLYVMASVNGVNGCIFLPDDWQTAIGIALNTNSHQTINLEEWNTLEQRGAIFLPTTADRLGTYFSYDQFEWNGYYWTSTSNGETSADCFVINHPSELSTSGTDNRRYGDAVRLVIEVK